MSVPMVTPWFAMESASLLACLLTCWNITAGLVSSIASKVLILLSSLHFFATLILVVPAWILFSIWMIRRESPYKMGGFLF